MFKRRNLSPEFEARAAKEASSGRKTIQEIIAHPVLIRLMGSVNLADWKGWAERLDAARELLVTEAIPIGPNEGLAPDRTAVAMELGGGHHPEPPLTQVLRVNQLGVFLRQQAEDIGCGHALLNREADRARERLLPGLHEGRRLHLLGDGAERHILLGPLDTVLPRIEAKSPVHKALGIGAAGAVFQ
ncbi:hypothetical protein [Synechococcus sp. BO 8801]|uniref:hypothetical protein n=1 Tax=Synechococcus sp. BO 8801 TaxID=169670 RepID=UPI00117D735F|nr:hypothetical protein [Synechococcus sp. BO 8801]